MRAQKTMSENRGADHWVTLATTGHPGATDTGKGAGKHTSKTR